MRQHTDNGVLGNERCATANVRTRHGAAASGSGRLWSAVSVQIEHELTGVLVHTLAAKDILLRPPQHAAVAPHDLGHDPRHTPVAAPRNEGAEQHRAQPLALEV